jgi:uncharacterized protein HemY
MLRKEISLVQGAGDQRRNGRAHYLLGRLLVKAGNPEEAKQEMAIAAQQDDTRGTSSGPAAEARVIGSSSLAQQETPDRSEQSPAAGAAPEDLRKLAEFKAQLSPVIAEAYNNLGALAAGGRAYVAAVDWFEKAGAWNSGLEGLDRNLGMAAFYARQWNKAARPLQRYVASHADDATARTALAETLQQIEAGKP